MTKSPSFLVRGSPTRLRHTTAVGVCEGERERKGGWEEDGKVESVWWVIYESERICGCVPGVSMRQR